MACVPVPGAGVRARRIAVERRRAIARQGSEDRLLAATQVSLRTYARCILSELVRNGFGFSVTITTGERSSRVIGGEQRRTVSVRAATGYGIGLIDTPRVSP